MTVRPPGRFSFVTLPGMIVVIRALAFRLAHSGSVHPIANVPPPATAPRYVLMATVNASRVVPGASVVTTDAVEHVVTVWHVNGATMEPVPMIVATGNVACRNTGFRVAVAHRGNGVMTGRVKMIAASWSVACRNTAFRAAVARRGNGVMMGCVKMTAMAENAANL